MSLENFQKSAIPLSELYFLRPYGILDPEGYEKYFSLHCYKPGTTEAPLLDHYFVSRWDVPKGHTYTASDIITSPTAHMTIFPDKAVLSILLGKRSITGKGKGLMAGIKFHPGIIHAYNKGLTPQLINNPMPASSIFSEIDSNFVEAIKTMTDEEIIANLEKIIRAHSITPGKQITMLTTILREMRAHKHIITVADVARHCHIPERTLQHLFKTYLGLFPKWFLTRNRLLGVLQEAHNSRTKPQWTKIAANLGYSTQAHFTTEFKRTIGVTPSEYLKAFHDIRQVTSFDT